MKANKAVKRLAKIEASMSDVIERYSASTPHLREVLQDAKAAVTRAKEAVSLQASSGTAENPPVNHSKPPSKAATKKAMALKRAEVAEAQLTAAKKKSARKKAATKKAAVKVPPAGAVKKPKSPMKEVATNTQTGTEAAGQQRGELPGEQRLPKQRWASFDRLVGLPAGVPVFCYTARALRTAAAVSDRAGLRLAAAHRRLA
jgi:hypothetical protein